MPTAAAISAGGSVLSSGLGIAGSLMGSKQQANAMSQAIAALQSMFGTAYGAINPVIQTGLGAANSVLPTLESLLTPGANMTKTLSQIPGFQFAQDWGQKAVQNLGTTTGLGGNVLTAGANYATGLAQQGYGNIVSLLENLFSSGGNIAASGASALGSVAGGFGNSLAQTISGIGGAMAQGTLGATNALSSGIGGAANTASNYMLLSRLAPSMSDPSNGGGAVNTPGTYEGS